MNKTVAAAEDEDKEQVPGRPHSNQEPSAGHQEDFEHEGFTWNGGDYFRGFMEERPEAPEGMEWLPAGDMCLYQLHPKATNSTGVSLQAEHQLID